MCYSLKSPHDDHSTQIAQTVNLPPTHHHLRSLNKENEYIAINMIASLSVILLWDQRGSSTCVVVHACVCLHVCGCKVGNSGLCTSSTSTLPVRFSPSQCISWLNQLTRTWHKLIPYLGLCTLVRTRII